MTPDGSFTTDYEARHAEVVEALRLICEEGMTPDQVETCTLDCKEDVTQRSESGQLIAGSEQSDAAAYYYTPEAVCFANADGGVILVGLDDKAPGIDALIGTNLDPEWLQERIYQMTDPNLSVTCIAEHHYGIRLLMIVVPYQATGPYRGKESKKGWRQPQRVGKSCYEMTTADMLQWSARRSGYDWSAIRSGQLAKHARPEAVEALRKILRDSGSTDRANLAEMPTESLLRSLQLCDSDGQLFRAGSLLLCPGDMPRIRYLRKASATSKSMADIERTGYGLAEDLLHVIERISEANPTVSLDIDGLVHVVEHAIPTLVVREAIVNAIMHRDWAIMRPIVVEHIGDEMSIVSPGGFYGGVTAETVLTTDSVTRNKRLADALRSLRIAEQEALGIDRMVVTSISFGHQPPTFEERNGRVRVLIQGGEPVREIVELVRGIDESLRGNPRIAVAVHLLREKVSISAVELAEAAQDRQADMTPTLDAAVEAGLLHRLSRTREDGHVGWRFSDHARERLEQTLPYARRPVDESVRKVANLAAQRDAISNADVQDRLGVNKVQASKILRKARVAGVIELAPGSSNRGRSVRYVASRSSG